ncbi:hypothetical protein CsSME_00043333 [Camellia sinensis var. sinensis]
MLPSQLILATVLASLLQNGDTAHQWPTVSHQWPARLHPWPAVPLFSRQMAGSSFSWPAGHWCIPQHGIVWCHSAPLAGSATLMAGTLALLADRVPLLAGRWPTHWFGKFQQKVLEDTLQAEPLKSNPEGFSGRETECLSLKLYLLISLNL